MKEKRQFRRVHYKEAVQYHLSHVVRQHASAIPAQGGCLSWDLSEGGIRFRSDSFIPLHTELSVRMSLGPDVPINLEAQVVWIQRIPHAEQYYLGLEFKRTPNYQLVRKTIQQYVAKAFGPE